MRRNSLGKWIAFGLLILPTAEIGAFILVAQWLGLEGAFFLLLATSLLGIAVLWYVGRVVIGRFARLLGERNAAMMEVGAGGLLTVLGGFLLVLPGFITDTIGLILIIPPVRRWIATRFGSQAGPHSQPELIDLEASEWRRLPEPRLKRRKGKPPTR
jgi:UPF0716 protein FxsA